MALGSWIDIDGRALTHNIQVFQRFIGNVTLGAVLKGNAYGHGLKAILPIIGPLVKTMFVFDPKDAHVIRDWEHHGNRKKNQIVVIGPTCADDVSWCCEQEVDVVLADVQGDQHLLDQAQKLKISRPLRVHIHVDTGLGREGLKNHEDLYKMVQNLKKCGNVVHLMGIMSHFANTEDVSEQDYALQQLASFEDFLNHFQELWPEKSSGLQRHLAASAATLILPQARFDLVRVGILLYGLWPSVHSKLSARIVMKEVPLFKPVLTWKVSSYVVKCIEAGSYVGYGCTYRCDQDTWVAVFPVGYFDGYPRVMTGKAFVLVGGHRCPVLGRIMMNFIVADVTHVVTKPQPVVATLIGHDGQDSITAEMLAEWSESLNYEVVSRIGSHLPRKVV